MVLFQRMRERPKVRKRNDVFFLASLNSDTESFVIIFPRYKLIILIVARVEYGTKCAIFGVFMGDFQVFSNYFRNVLVFGLFFGRHGSQEAENATVYGS